MIIGMRWSQFFGSPLVEGKKGRDSDSEEETQRVAHRFRIVRDGDWLRSQRKLSRAGNGGNPPPPPPPKRRELLVYFSLSLFVRWEGGRDTGDGPAGTTARGSHEMKNSNWVFFPSVEP